MANKNDRLPIISCAMSFDNDGKQLHQGFRGVGVPCFWLEARHAASGEVYGEAWSKIRKTDEDRTELSDGTSESVDEYQQWNWTWNLGEFIFLVVRTVKGAEPGVDEASRRDSVGANDGVLFQQTRVRSSSFICGGLARQAR